MSAAVIKPCELSLWQHLCNSGKVFSFARDLTAVAGTSEVDWILYRNPTGSGVDVRLNEIIMSFVPNAANQNSTFRIYRSPEVTSAGTPITVFKVKPSQAAEPKLLVYSDPTIASRGTLITLFTVTAGNVVRDQQLSRFIEAGRDLLVTVHPGAGNLQHSYVASHAEG